MVGPMLLLENMLKDNMENFIEKLKNPKVAVCAFMLVWTVIMFILSLFSAVPQSLSFLHSIAVLASIVYLFPLWKRD